MDQPIMLTATDVMNYHYCPRIIYYTRVLQRPQITTKKEYKGREKDDEFRSKGKRTKVVKSVPPFPKLFRVSLVSECLGLKTIADSIMINEPAKEAYPLQAKYSFTPKAVYRSQKAQLQMEALLIEDVLGYASPAGFIKYVRSNQVIRLPLGDRTDALHAFKSIREIIAKEVFPKPTLYRKRCIDCCFRRYCWGDNVRE